MARYGSVHSDYIAQLLADGGAYAEGRRDFDAMRTEEGLFHEGRDLTPVSLAPMVLSQSQARQIRQCLRDVRILLERVAELFLQTAALDDYLPAYADVLDTLRAGSTSPHVGVLRVDGIPTADGYKIVEFSTGAPAGVVRTGRELALWSAWLQSRTGGGAIDLSDQPFAVNPNLFADYLAADYCRLQGRAPESAAVVTLPNGSVNEVDLIAGSLESIGVPVRRLTTHDVRGVSDLVSDQSNSASRVMAYNKFDQVRFVADLGSRAYFDLITHRELVVQPSLIAHCILDDKGIMAFLTSSVALDYLDEKELSTVQRYVRWTRMVRDGIVVTVDGIRADLHEYVLLDRARLVLKPTDRARGLGVVVGRDCGEEEWRASVQRAFAGRPHVIQEFVDPPSFHLQGQGGPPDGRLVYGVDGYAFGEEFAGYMCRAAHSAVVNVGSGGFRVPVLTA